MHWCRGVPNLLSFHGKGLIHFGLKVTIFFAMASGQMLKAAITAIFMHTTFRQPES